MKLTVIGGGLLAVLAGCGSPQSPEAAIEDMYRAIDGGNCSGFQDRFSQASRQTLGPKLDTICQTVSAQLKTKGDEQRLKQLHILEKTEDGDRVTMRVQPEMRDGHREDAAQVRMIRENGAWKVEPVK
jgi:hypothetical protein